MSQPVIITAALTEQLIKTVQSSMCVWSELHADCVCSFCRELGREHKSDCDGVRMIHELHAAAHTAAYTG